MLYDPKWEVKTKADPFALESLISWLEAQDPAERYDYCQSHRCLIGQYLKQAGITPYELDGFDINPVFDNAFDAHFIAIGKDAYGPVAQAREWTFGAALARARSQRR